MAKYRIVKEKNHWYAEKYVLLLGWVYVSDTVSFDNALACEKSLFDKINKPKTIIVKEIKV